MTLLESTIDRAGNLQGVILALVSAEESDAEREPAKNVRMYNLASVLSLVKWASSQKVNTFAFRRWCSHMLLTGCQTSGNTRTKGVESSADYPQKIT